VIAGIRPVAAGVPFVESAIPGLRYDQAEAVIHEVGRADPEPGAPPSIADAERVVGYVAR